MGDAQLAGLATVGCASATAVARCVGSDKDSLSAGLIGYNGALVGCAFAVFLPSYVAVGLASPDIAWLTPTLWATQANVWLLQSIGWNPLGSTLTTIASVDPFGFAFLAFPTAVFAALSALLAGTLGPVISPIPQLTLPFNIVTLTALAYIRPFSGMGAQAVADLPVGLAVLDPVDWFEVVLNGVSQIFVVAQPWTGFAILAGIATYSPRAALATFVGSAIGTITALLMGADGDEVSEGLWGYNSALTALAVSIFLVPTGISFYALTCVGAVAASVTTLGMKLVVGKSLAAPCLTLPFCAISILCILSGGRVPGLVRASVPHSPEANLHAYRAMHPQAW